MSCGYTPLNTRGIGGADGIASASMELFARLVPRGSTVLEIGAHIGYLAQYFSTLTGIQGRVFCFEPSPENMSPPES